MAHNDHLQQQPRIIDGFVIGIQLPIKTDWIWSRYVRPEFKSQADATRLPFQIGDLVSKFIQRPADLSQLWRVVGLCFRPYASGWKVTTTRDGCTDLHRNSLYAVDSRLLHLVQDLPKEGHSNTQ